jgi:hypothetical protein
MTESKVVSYGQVASINELAADKARICLEGSPLQVEVVDFTVSPDARGIRVGQYLVKHEDGLYAKSAEPVAEKKPETSVFSKKHDVPDPMTWPGEAEEKQAPKDTLAEFGRSPSTEPEPGHVKHEKHHGKEHKK